MYVSSGYVVWAVSSLALAVVPLGLVQLVSYRWQLCRGNASPSLRLMHFCQIGLLCRLVALYSARGRYQQTRRASLYTVYVYEFIDLTQLQLLLSRLQSAPQFWLQLHIVLAYRSWHLVQGFSIVCCFVSLLWSCLAYSLCNSCIFVRSNHKVLVNWSSYLLQVFWRLCFLSARLAAFLCLSQLLASYCLLLLFLRLAANYLLVTWPALRDLPRPSPVPCCRVPGTGVLLQNLVVALAMCFSQVGAERSWRCLLLHHSVCVTENVVTASVFYLVGDVSASLQIVLPSIILATTVIGLLALAADQWRCHANASMSADKIAAACVANTSLLSSACDFSLHPSVLPTTSPVCSLSTMISSTNLLDTPVDVSPAQASLSIASSSVVNQSAQRQPLPSVSFSADGVSSRVLSEIMPSVEVEPASFHSDSVTGADNFSPPVVSDFSELDYVSEGDITLPTANTTALNQSAPPAVCLGQSGRSGDAIGKGDNQSVPPAVCLSQSKRLSDATGNSDNQSGVSGARSWAVAPDYENLCPGNPHPGPLAVRAWSTYSDVADSTHDMSVALSTSGGVSVPTARAGARHTYENTDNVQLMLRYLDEEEEGVCRLDVSSLVATIDALTDQPRRSHSSDNLSSGRPRGVLAPQTSRLNTSFDTARVLTARRLNDDWRARRNTGAICRQMAEPSQLRSLTESKVRQCGEPKNRENPSYRIVNKENTSPSLCYI